MDRGWPPKSRRLGEERGVEADPESGQRGREEEWSVNVRWEKMTTTDLLPQRRGVDLVTANG